MNLAAPAVSNRLQLGRFQPIRVTISAKRKGQKRAEPVRWDGSDLRYRERTMAAAFPA
jgi:hypothetical protein